MRPCVIGKHQRAEVSLTRLDVGEVFVTDEARDGFRDGNQQRVWRGPAALRIQPDPFLADHDLKVTLVLAQKRVQRLQR